MYYVDPNFPLPIDIGIPAIDNEAFYICMTYSYPKAYCFDTRIKAIDKIIAIERKLSHYRKIWSPLYYHELPMEISVIWNEHTLINAQTGKPITSKIIFNTELEALDYAINHPDPIFINRKRLLHESI